MSLLPSEEWGPYKALWSRHLILARDEHGNPTPWTHGVRRNKTLWVPVFLVVVAWLVLGSRESWRRVLLAFGLGFLAGHFFWCG